MNKTIQKINKELESGFFGFWVRRYKVSILAIFLIIAIGIFSLYSIPKESSPDIKFGIIGITTPYIGVNPNDIDALITEKIENEIKGIEGIKKITSTSAVGVSSITVELTNEANTREVVIDIKDEIDKINLPEDAEDTIVLELSSSSELMFEVLLYGNPEKFSDFDLSQLTQKIKSNLEGKNGIDSIDLGGLDLDGGGSSDSSDYEIKVLLDKEKIELLGLKLNNISQTIRSYNKNTPIGNYAIGELNYDFRFDGELRDIEDLKKVVLKGENGSFVTLGDISEIVLDYNDDTIKKLGFQGKSGYNYASMVFNKKQGINIFSVSEDAKNALIDFIANNSEYEGLEVLYTNDLSEIIREDYKNLGNTAIITLVLVFITILIFVGLRESIIASLLIPLAFLMTFTVLDTMGMTLNFLTNFSLVLTLGIAIDTVIVIIEGASDKLKMGYNKKAAMLLAVKEYKAPLIAGTLTTLVAFLPMIFLPGVLGKFLAFIPITVFTTLVAALFLSLTLSSALFIMLVKNGTSYHEDEKLEETFSQKQKDFLASEREGKTLKKGETYSTREKILGGMGTVYFNILKKFLSSRFARIVVVIAPILGMVATFIFLAPNIGFTLFPQTDESVINIEIKTQAGASEKALEKYLPQIDQAIYIYPELKLYYNSISGNTISTFIQLQDTKDRQDLGQRSVFEIEELILNDLSELEKYGLSVSIKTQSGGPPAGRPVGVKVIASNSNQITELKNIAEDFKEYLRSLEGVKNVTTSSSDTPGQFIFQFDKIKLADIGLTPDDLLGEIFSYTNGIKAGSIKSTFEDNDIVLKIKEFDDYLSPDDIKNLVIETRAGTIKVGDYADYDFVQGVSSINRDNTNISIAIESDIVNGFLPTDVQPKLIAFAEGYTYPEGISFGAGGENEENSELIISTFRSLFISVFLIFSILVFQFNSFKQPAIVLYSVVLALLGVNIGLWLTGNPYSMTFAIGFIALTGVVVNDAIILIDRINNNLEKGLDGIYAVAAAGKSRLQPILVTTLTTVFGVLPLAMQDEFWAGLGYTMVFGLIAGSAMTLFVIPALYYEVVLRKKKKIKWKKLFGKLRPKGNKRQKSK